MLFRSWLNQILDGQEYICGPRLTYVDVAGYVLMRFLAHASLPIPEELTHVTRYMAGLARHEIIGQSR